MSTLDKVARVLEAIPGVQSVAALSREQRLKVVELESDHEKGLSLPVRNLGVSLMAVRGACFVLLKAGTFRAPLAPTVYMVEERGTSENDNFEADSVARDHAAGGLPGRDHLLTLAGKRYRVVGEEVTGGIGNYAEPVIPLEGSFVIFPQRRSSPRVPCFFLLPPLPFPELEMVGGELGITEIISISPSLVSDAYLREALGFSPSNSFATLLVGFDLISP